MGLTDRSRLNSLRRKQERMRRKQENQKHNSHSVLSLEPSKLVSEPVNELSIEEKAWQKYLHAKAIYEETKQPEHWQYMQQCISDYEKTLRSTAGIRA